MGSQGRFGVARNAIRANREHDYCDNLRRDLIRSDVDPHPTAAVLPVTPDNSVGAGKTPLVKEMTANALGGSRLASSPYPRVRSYLCAGDSGEEKIAGS